MFLVRFARLRTLLNVRLPPALDDICGVLPGSSAITDVALSRLAPQS